MTNKERQMKFQEEIMDDMLESDIEKYLTQWISFTNFLQSYRDSDESTGEVLSRFRKKWMRDPRSFKADWLVFLVSQESEENQKSFQDSAQSNTMRHTYR